jgi:DNA (cytosine-5)-methyltransferase 1
MSRPKLLDLFCGAGGAAMGYHLAGFDVYGVDIKHQPNYPFWFRQADALEFPLDGFDVIHASPPCQGYSDMAKPTKREYPLLIEPIRERLQAAGVPYVIENVEGAPLIDPVLLCGVERGLRLGEYVLRRHRLFESNVPLRSNGCACHKGDGITMAVYGGGNTTKARTSATSGGRPYKGTADERRAIMGMPWATMAEVNEAIPPAYAEFVGRQVIKQTKTLRWTRVVDGGTRKVLLVDVEDVA